MPAYAGKPVQLEVGSGGQDFVVSGPGWVELMSLDMVAKKKGVCVVTANIYLADGDGKLALHLEGSDPAASSMIIDQGGQIMTRAQTLHEAFAVQRRQSIGFRLSGSGENSSGSDGLIGRTMRISAICSKGGTVPAGN
jgi:hypothetical protein